MHRTTHRTRKKETKEPRLPSSERNALVLESSAIVEVPTALGAGAGAGGSDQYLATIRDKDILKEEVSFIFVHSRGRFF